MYHYIVPTISSLPAGYDCTMIPPLSRVGRRLVGGAGSVRWRRTIYREGVVEGEVVDTVEFRDHRLVAGRTVPFCWSNRSAPADAPPAFLESEFRVADDAPLLSAKDVIPFYTIYSAPGRKSVFSDNADKYAAPPVINQIAAFGRFADGYPVVHLDLDRDCGESLVLINPYRNAVLCTVMSADGRTLPRVRVPALSARRIDLVRLLPEGTSRWTGRIQITANNRLITYDVKHSLADPSLISDHEHLDPYRADPTHLPAFQWARQAVGRALSNRGLGRRRL